MGFTPISESEIAAAPVSSGFTPISNNDIAPAPSVSIYDRVLGGLKGIAKAGTDVALAPADLLYRGGNAALDFATGSQTNLAGGYPSDVFGSALNKMAGGQGDQTTENVTHLLGNIGTLVAAPSQAKTIASNIPLLSDAAGSSRLASLLSKAVGYGAEGAGISALMNSKSENLGSDMATGAALNIATPAALDVTGSLARGLKNAALEGSRKLELSAFGANKTRIARAYDKVPEVLQDNPLTTAIQEFRKAGGGAGSLEGTALLNQLDDQVKPLVSDLTSKLASATEKQKEVIVPAFNFTNKYIESLPGAAKAEARALADDLITKTVNNTDGTLTSLQAEKVALAPLIKQSSYGAAANPTKAEILKYIRADLRKTIEDGYAAATGTSGQVIKDINKQIGNREALYPLFEDIRNTGEARDPLKWLMENMRTSGGFGMATIAASGVAGPAAAAIPLVGGYLATPAGRLALSNGLRSSMVQAPLKATEKAAQVLSSVSNVSNALASKRDNATIKESNKVSTLLNSVLSNPKESATAPQPTETNMEDAKNFNTKVVDIAKDLDTDPQHLLKVMNFETGGTFDSTVKNKAGSGATGLIQFMPKTAKDLTGASTMKAAIKILEGMTSTEQLDYVKKYLAPFRGKLNSLEDVYMAVLYPKAVGKEADYALFREGTKAYWQNRGLDIDGDGIVTKEEAASKVKDYKGTIEV